MTSTKSQTNKLKKYFIGGIDFFIDTNGQAVFIEANSDAHFFYSYPPKYHPSNIMNDICRILDAGTNKFLFLITEKTYNEDEEYKTKYLKFKKEFGKENCSLELLSDLKDQTIEDWTKKYQALKEKAILYTPYIKIKKILWEAGCHTVFNPYPIANITIDKSILYDHLKPTKHFRVPVSFDFKTKTELLKIVQKQKWNTCVIKPRKGQKGRSVLVIDDTKELKTTRLKKGEWIVQEKIEINKINGNFWDIRAYVIDGTFSDTIGRLSPTPVVNLCVGGGSLFKPDKMLVSKVKKASEEIVKQINTLSKKYAGII